MTETSDATFPKSIRLLNAKDYSDVFSSVDIKISTKFFLCLTRFKTDGDARLGLIVAKKNIRLAVDRNRMKRVMRESFRIHKAVIPTYDIVLMVKRDALSADHALLNKELQYIWRKLKQRAKS